MGQTHVTVTVRNPLERQRCWEGTFLVGTGANDTLVPRRFLEAIGIEPEGRRTYRLADGGEVEFETAFAVLEFMDDVAPVRVIFGEDAAEPLLGVIALKLTGVVVNLDGGKLERNAVLRL